MHSSDNKKYQIVVHMELWILFCYSFKQTENIKINKWNWNESYKIHIPIRKGQKEIPVRTHMHPIGNLKLSRSRFFMLLTSLMVPSSLNFLFPYVTPHITARLLPIMDNHKEELAEGDDNLGSKAPLVLGLLFSWWSCLKTPLSFLDCSSEPEIELVRLLHL